MLPTNRFSSFFHVSNLQSNVKAILSSMSTCLRKAGEMQRIQVDLALYCKAGLPGGSEMPLWSEIPLPTPLSLSHSRPTITKGVFLKNDTSLPGRGRKSIS